MKELGINPKDYKYLKSDDKSTTLQHKKGHILTIAHNVLSPKNQAILKALATASKPTESEEKSNGGYVKEIHSDENEPGYTKMAAGGVPGHATAYDMNLPCLNPNCKSHGKPHPNCRCYGFAEGGGVEDIHFCRTGKAHKPGCEYAKGGPVPQDSPGIMSSRQPFKDGGESSEDYGTSSSLPANFIPSPPPEAPMQHPSSHSHDILIVSPLPERTPEQRKQDIDDHLMNGGHLEDINPKFIPPGYVPPQHRVDEMDQLRQEMSKTPKRMNNLPNFDDGGGVSAPPHMPSKEQGEAVARGVDDYPTPTLSQTWSNIKSGLGLSDAPSVAQANGGEIRRHMYANPQTPVAQDDTAPQQDELDAAAPQQPQPQQPPIAQNPAANEANGIVNQVSANSMTPEQARKDEAMAMVKNANDFGADVLAGHIQPKTYADLFAKTSDGKDRGTFSKLRMLFGVLAGGIGSGLTHQPNVALEMMNKEIERDLDAQKASAANQQNMWSQTYNHLTQEAQARNIDTSSKSAQAELTEKTNVAAQMFHNQGTLSTLARQVAAMPEGTAKEAYKKALYMTAQQTDMKNATLADQFAAKAIMFDKAGKGWNMLGAPQQQQNQPTKPSAKQQPGQKPVGKTSATNKPTVPKYSILSPGSQSKYEDIMNDLDPMWSKNKDLINHQYTQAQQAEKILNGPTGDGKNGIDDVMNQMADAQSKMGYYGHAHGRLQEMAGALPLIGGAAGAATNLMPDTASEKRYNALKTTLESDMGTALQGIMTPTDIHNAVSKYAPAYQDEPKDKEWKKQQLVGLIKKALQTSALAGAGLVKKK